MLQIHNNLSSAMNLRVSQFESEAGSEFFISLEAPADLEFEAGFHALMDAYDQALNEHKLSAETEITGRFYLKNVALNGNWLRDSLASRFRHSFTSVIGQPPISGSSITFESYHIRGSQSLQKTAGHHCLEIDRKSYRSIWTHSRVHSAHNNPYDQTRAAFESLADSLQTAGARVREHVMRTWLYVHDIDRNYQDVVDARKNYFRSIGLTAGTRFIASTGIGAEQMDRNVHLSMDSLSVLGLKSGQIEYMDAPEFMGPTSDYGVTFERGVRIIYGDRSHYYISGTASIDAEGNIVHIGNVEKQTERALINVIALLQAHDADINDLKTVTVYVREPADGDCVKKYLQQRLPVGLPMTTVVGAVCRPLWLVELEAVAVNGRGSKRFAPFC